jgi:hypothetical protein
MGDREGTLREVYSAWHVTRDARGPCFPTLIPVIPVAGWHYSYSSCRMAPMAVVHGHVNLTSKSNNNENLIDM